MMPVLERLLGDWGADLFLGLLLAALLAAFVWLEPGHASAED